MATDSNVRRSSHGVRTYRGRTLEEILPQIREELGPDAIILREREGLVGGVGGFFAQRFIEVDARRGDGQSIDIYDDEPEDDLRSRPAVADEVEPAAPERKALLPPEPVELGGRGEAALEEPVDLSARRAAATAQPAERSQPRPFVPPSVQVERPTPPPQQPEQAEQAAPRARPFETGVFMERLREASAKIEQQPEAEAPSEAPSAPEAPDPEGEAGGAPVEQRRPVARPRPERPQAARPERARSERPERPERPERKPRPPRPRPAGRTRPAPTPTTEQPEQQLAGAEPSLEPGPHPAPSLEPSPHPEPSLEPAPYPEPSLEPAPRPEPSPVARHRPSSLRAGLPTGEPRPASPAPARLAEPAPPAGAAVPPAPRRIEFQGRRHVDEGLRGTLLRLLGGRFRSGALPKPAPARPLDPVAATEIATGLSTRGASQAWTSQLISTAGAHGSPLASSLRAAAEAEVARRIVPAPSLPATGAAVAFIGAGGSGKTRCTAALASAYRRGSTLGVTVIALDNPDGARELKRLLADDGVPVLSLSGERAQRAVESARDGGFVIIDTPTATPTDPAEVDALGAGLEPLALDATYVTLPATLGPQAARRALASFGRLNPSAVAITHTDETDQIAVVVEIAIANRIPLAYFHAGTDHRTALSAVDALAVAEQLLS